MSFLTYNGLQMQMIRTVRFQREAVYSEDRTDYLWTRFLLEVDCVYNPAATAFAGNPPVATPTTLPAVTDVAIRHQLMVPRRQLSFTVGADTLLASPQPGLLTDAHNGPIPLDCTVQQIHNTKTFLVRYSIETCLLECPSGPTGPALVSHRWSETHDVDGDYFTVRTVRGRAKFRSDILLANGQVPDDFRGTLVVGIPPQFKRERINIVAQSDNTELMYEVIDRQVYQSLGANSPATKVEVFYSTSTGKGAARYYASIQVRCWGKPSTTKSALAVLCVQIAATRINLSDPNQYIEQAGFTEDVMHPFVEFQCTIWIQPSAANKGKIVLPPAGAFTDGVGTIFSAGEVLNPAPTGDGASRGDWLGRAAASALAAPCGATATITTAVLPGSTNDPNALQTGPIVSLTTVGALPPETNEFSTVNQQGFYTEFHLNTHYETDQHRLQVPVGAPGPAACQFIDVAAPTTRKIVVLTGERLSQFPQLPLLDTGDPNDVLLYNERVPSARELLGDGKTYIHRASIRYIYGLKVAKKEGDDFHAGAVPYALRSEPTNVLQAVSFQDGIIGTGGSATLRTP